MLKLLWFSFAMTLMFSGYTQSAGQGFFYWGYNRTAFARSNIHFQSPDYNFSLYDVKAKDRPTAFGKKYWGVKTLSIPQYNYRVGYRPSEKWLFSLGMDHMKYVLQNGQTALIHGDISEMASSKYAGSYDGLEEIVLDPSFIQYEHTDGFNYLSAKASRIHKIKSFKNDKYVLQGIAGVGAGLIITKTRVYLFNEGLDNDFHLSGYALAAHTGLRFLAWRHLFIATEGMAGYSWLPDVPLRNKAPMKAQQFIGYFQWSTALGYAFSIRK